MLVQEAIAPPSIDVCSSMSSGNMGLARLLEVCSEEKYAGMATSEVNFRPSPPRFTGRVH